MDARLSCDSGPPEPRTWTAIPVAPHDCADAEVAPDADKRDAMMSRAFSDGLNGLNRLGAHMSFVPRRLVSHFSGDLG